VRSFYVNECGNFIVATKQKILVISIMSSSDFDAASRRHNDVILTSFSVYLFTMTMLHSVIYVTGNRHWLHRARATVELLRQETPEIIAPNLWFRIKKQPISQSLSINRFRLLRSVMSTRNKSIVWKFFLYPLTFIYRPRGHRV